MRSIAVPLSVNVARPHDADYADDGRIGIGKRPVAGPVSIAARPGAYLRVITPGVIEAGDAIQIVSRPEHGVSAGLLFQAVPTERDLLPGVLPAMDTMNPAFAQELRERLEAGHRSGI